MTDLDPVHEHVSGLVEELEDLLGKHKFEDPNAADPHLKKAKLIKAEIESLGFVVKWSVSIDVKTLKSKARVEIYQKKEFLSPEEEAAYRIWHEGAKERFKKLKKDNP